MNKSNVLLDRSHAGLTVEVGITGSGRGTLRCIVGNDSAAAFVPADKLLDVFAHPACYLSAEQCQRLFGRKPETTEDIEPDSRRVGYGPAPHGVAEYEDGA